MTLLRTVNGRSRTDLISLKPLQDQTKYDLLFKVTITQNMLYVTQPIIVIVIKLCIYQNVFNLTINI